MSHDFPFAVLAAWPGPCPAIRTISKVRNGRLARFVCCCSVLGSWILQPRSPVSASISELLSRTGAAGGRLQQTRFEDFKCIPTFLLFSPATRRRYWAFRAGQRIAALTATAASNLPVVCAHGRSLSLVRPHPRLGQGRGLEGAARFVLLQDAARRPESQNGLSRSLIAVRPPGCGW